VVGGDIVHVGGDIDVCIVGDCDVYVVVGGGCGVGYDVDVVDSGGVDVFVVVGGVFACVLFVLS